jgi:negative regulator of genetic competence, sporulation and motility
MTLCDKYGFKPVVLAPDSPIVKLFFTRHLEELDYPRDIVPQGQLWIGIVKDEQVFAIFGSVMEPNGRLNVSDFYAWPGRWGKLAAYAAIEEIKIYVDNNHIPLTCMSRWDNEPMNRAIERAFGKVASHVVYRYN